MNTTTELAHKARRLFGMKALVRVISSLGLVSTLIATPVHAASADADLADLSPSTGHLSPVFSANTTSYTLIVGETTTSMTVTPSLSDAAASLKVNGTASTSGDASATLTLVMGNNTITTEVTAEDGTTKKSYVITVTRLSLTVSNNADAGAGSLRQALANAALVDGPNSITFASGVSGKIITLASELAVDDTEGVTVDVSSLATGLTLSGADTVRLLQVKAGATLNLVGLTLRSGSAGLADGGAILNLGTANVTGCTFTANTARDGGAIANAGVLTLTRCTLTGNVASRAGGAIQSTTNTTLTHCTVSKNKGMAVGGIQQAAARATLNFCIVSGNTLLDEFTSSDVDGDVTPGTSLISDDAYLAPLGSYGGTTQTMALLAGSPARDAADSSSATADQRGFGIIGSPDLGAYESQLGLIDDMIVDQNAGSTGVIDFTVGNAAALTATSSNTVLVPNAAIKLSGTGADRGIAITPVTGKFGEATITVKDAQRGDSRSFTITVRGFGIFVFGDTGYSVEEGKKAVVAIQRTGGTAGTVTINVATTTRSVASGVLASAVTDYTPASQTLTFLDGEDSKTFEIDTTLDALAEGPESFLVALSVPSKGTLGTPATCLVTLIDLSGPDPTIPTLLITSPAVNAVVGVNAGGTMNIIGIASDQKGVKKVEARLAMPGGGFTPFTEADMGTPASASTTYTAAVIPFTGANTVEVRVTDFKDNTRSVTRAFKVSRPLQVSVSGPGRITTPGFLGSSFREVGKPYTISAFPSSMTSVFGGWVVNQTAGTGITPEKLLKTPLTFTFVEGLTITAQFVPNPFGPGRGGNFTGLVLPSSSLPAPTGTPTNISTVGYASIMVMPFGMFSGRLNIDGGMYPLIGTFSPMGVAPNGSARTTTVTVNRFGKSSLDVTLQFDLSGISGQITGTVSQRTGNTIQTVSVLTADRSYFLPSALAPVSIAGTTGQRYNAILPARASQPGLTTAGFPQGTGTVSFTVSRMGSVMGALRLADGTMVTSSGALSKYLALPVFASLNVGKGCFAAAVTFDPTLPNSDVLAPNCLWIRPAQPTVQWYPAGWPTGIQVDMIGTKAPLSSTRLIPGLNSTGAATLTFAQGLLTETVTKDVYISLTNVVTKADPTDTSFLLNLDRSSGGISGMLIQAGSPRPLVRSYYGTTLVKPGSSNQGTFGFFMSPAAIPVDGLGQSGTVSLLPRP